LTLPVLVSHPYFPIDWVCTVFQAISRTAPLSVCLRSGQIFPRSQSPSDDANFTARGVPNLTIETS
jgi:hypothetical protein